MNLLLFNAFYCEDVSGYLWQPLQYKAKSNYFVLGLSGDCFPTYTKLMDNLTTCSKNGQVSSKRVKVL